MKVKKLKWIDNVTDSGKELGMYAIVSIVKELGIEYQIRNWSQWNGEFEKGKFFLFIPNKNTHLIFNSIKEAKEKAQEHLEESIISMFYTKTSKKHKFLSDEEYIKELEGIACFLAGCYEKAKETYFDKHMETCSRANPDRRELTKAEQNEWQRFPMIQGTRLQQVISTIAKSEKSNPKNISGLIERFTS
jgi:septum formation inhibitor MinC